MPSKRRRSRKVPESESSSRADQTPRSRRDSNLSTSARNTISEPRYAKPVTSNDEAQSQPPDRVETGEEAHYSATQVAANTINATTPSTPQLSFTNNEKDKGFKLRPAKFFKAGRVLDLPWPEPGGPGVPTAHKLSGSRVSVGMWNQLIHSKLRNFIVIKSQPQHCLAVAVFSHGDRGAKGDMETQGIVYTGSIPPMPLATETLNGVSRLQRVPIRVFPDMPSYEFTENSRINYSKAYTIEYNIPVRSFGVVQTESIRPLIAQFVSVLGLEPPNVEEEQSAPQQQQERAVQLPYRAQRQAQVHTDPAEEIITRLARQYQAQNPKFTEQQARLVVERLFEQRKARAQATMHEDTSTQDADADNDEDDADDDEQDEQDDEDQNDEGQIEEDHNAEDDDEEQDDEDEDELYE